MNLGHCTVALWLLAGCAAPVLPPSGAACEFWAIRRAALPRPLPATSEGRWVAITDQGMGAACYPAMTRG